jgi:hypothetical protein
MLSCCSVNLYFLIGPLPLLPSRHPFIFAVLRFLSAGTILLRFLMLRKGEMAPICFPATKMVKCDFFRKPIEFSRVERTTSEHGTTLRNRPWRQRSTLLNPDANISRSIPACHLCLLVHNSSVILGGTGVNHTIK